MKLILLTKGMEAMVDDEDFDFLMQWRWFAWTPGYSTFYARKTCKVVPGVHSRMHREVMGRYHNVWGSILDHIDGNGLNNCKSNLRFCTHAENSRNAGPNALNKSGIKGVCWHVRSKKYIATISLNRKLIHIGYFTDPIEAAKAYNEAAIKYHGEFARLNVW